MKRSAFEHRLKDVVRKAMTESGVSQSQLVQRWHSHPGYFYEQREVVRTIVWRLLHPHYPVVLSHFELALKLMDCDMQISIVPRGSNEPKEQGQGRKETRAA